MAFRHAQALGNWMDISKKWYNQYIVAREKSKKIHTDYLRGYIDSFDETTGIFRRLWYKLGLGTEPDKIAAYREELSERKDLTERLTPS